jgi:peptidoglycan hydrolase-like protein with peptidoglycan-binding domain
LVSGQAPFFVNGQPVIGLSAGMPLWRDLSTGMAGPDVSALQVELDRLGYEVDVTSRFDWKTRVAVTKLFASVGGKSDSGDLPLSSVMWLPATEIMIGECLVRIGDIVNHGDDILQVAGGLQALVLAEVPGHNWMLSYGDALAEVGADGWVTSKEFLALVEKDEEYQYITSTGQGSMQMTVQLAEPISVLVVPPSSIVVTDFGKGCLVVEGDTVPVEIVSSSLGRTYVRVTNDASPSSVTLLPDSLIQC